MCSLLIFTRFHILRLIYLHNVSRILQYLPVQSHFQSRVVDVDDLLTGRCSRSISRLATLDLKQQVYGRRKYSTYQFAESHSSSSINCSGYPIPLRLCLPAPVRACTCAHATIRDDSLCDSWKRASHQELRTPDFRRLVTPVLPLARNSRFIGHVIHSHRSQKSFIPRSDVREKS